MTLAAARRLALSFPEATEQDHHGMPSFRVDGKIFTTVPDEAPGDGARSSALRAPCRKIGAYFSRSELTSHG